MKLNPTLRSAIITSASFIFVITAVSAWTGPSVSAPNGNVSAPITVSATNQEKTGGLWLGSLGITGKAVSSSTVDSDPNNTLVTKDYLDARLAALAPATPTTPTVTTWDTPGTYSYVVPSGVTSITVTGTGGGGSGFSMGPNPGGSWFYSGSGGGGVIDQSVAVTPDETLTVVVGGTEQSTYLKRGVTNLISLGAGGRGSFSQPAGGTGPLPGEAGKYQACMMTATRAFSGAAATIPGTVYGYGNYSECDYAAGSGGPGYFSITD